jgi:peptidase E
LLNQTLFLHGGNEFHADSAESVQFDQFFINAIGQARVGIFPGASTSIRDQVATVAFASGYFSLYGIELSEVSPEEFPTVDALILPGGSPQKLFTELAPHRNQMLDLFERGVIYGASAGAMVLGAGFTLGGNWSQGLALGEFEALVHFGGQLPEGLTPSRPSRALYGIPEGAGLAVAKSGEILAKSSGVRIRA